MQKPSSADIEKFCGTCDQRTSDGNCVLDAGMQKQNLMQGLLAISVLPTLHEGYDPLIEKCKERARAQVKEWTDQERYVHRGECGWASINGKNGIMTNDGFMETA